MNLVLLAAMLGLAGEPQTAPPKQITIEILSPGAAAGTLVLPPGARMQLRATTVVAEPERGDATLAKGDVSITMSLDGIALGSVYADEVRIISRPRPARLSEVTAELETMGASDQALRRQFAERAKREHLDRDAVVRSEEWRRQIAVDQENQKRLDEIVGEFGWPGQQQFGAEAAEAAFLIVQHAGLEYQRRYLPLVRKAVLEHALKRDAVALLEDRIDVAEGKPQRYGTQVRYNKLGVPEPEPIEDAEHVDQRRAELGLPPLAEYLQSLAPARSAKTP